MNSNQHFLAVMYRDGSAVINVFQTDDEAGLFHGQVRADSNAIKTARGEYTKRVSPVAVQNEICKRWKPAHIETVGHTNIF